MACNKKRDQMTIWCVNVETTVDFDPKEFLKLESNFSLFTD